MRDERIRAAISLYDRFTHDGLDRRAFMAELTRIAGGAAAASLLLSSIACRAAAPQVAHDDDRLTLRTVEWEARPGRRYRGYNAAPRGSVDLPVVLVIHENRGLNDHIRDVARRVAIAGYSAVAPDFLSPAGGTPADEDRARAMIGELDMAETVADGAASIRWLASAEGGSRKVGIVGFCWGGALVNRLAVASGEALAAGVSFYGPAPSPSEAGQVRAPLLIHLAERDERVNATALPWIAALRGAGKEVRAINHHGVDHAFHNDTSAARYNAEAARRAWATTLEFFDRHLRGES
ncbi:MAG TPA: dienelactone hydrolase family protein [Allosphingosinicella sp.]|nr:dienelactone hydrolase family protein [Allosphingosinicella sp.]